MFFFELDSNKEVMYIRYCVVFLIENGYKYVIIDIYWLFDIFEVSFNSFIFFFCWIVKFWKILFKEDVLG